MCKDDALRRKVLASFPPISSSGCLRRSESTESLSLYSKSKASNSWSSNSSQGMVKNRKRSTNSLTTPRYGRGITEERLRLTRSKSIIGLDGKVGDYLPAAANHMTDGHAVFPTRERRTSKESRISSTTASSSLPKVVEEQTTCKPIPQPRKSLQRELTIIIRYEDNECIQEIFTGHRETLKLPAEEEQKLSDRVGFLAPAKSNRIIQWLKKCDFTEHNIDDVHPTDSETITHLPALVTKDTDTDT